MCKIIINKIYLFPYLAGRNGNVGVLYLIKNEDNLENIILNPPPMPFVAALPISFFNM